MAWQGTKTWSPKELGRATDFNTYISDNLDYLLNGRAGGGSVLNEASEYTINSSTYTSIDTTDMARTLTVAEDACHVLVLFAATVSWSGSGTDVSVVQFDLLVDNVRYSADDGLAFTQFSSNVPGIRTVPIVADLTLDQGSHTIELQWRRITTAGSNATITLYAGGGTSNYNIHPNFIVREW